MSEMEIKRRNVIHYVVYTYGLFGLLLITLGGIATQILHGTPSVMMWLMAITAWTPTYVFLLMFKKICPNGTVLGFYRRVFSEKLSIRLVVTTGLTQTLIFAASVFMVSVQTGIPTMNLLDFSFPTVISALFISLITGATGEETGWRGYLLPAVQERLGVVKGSLIVSLIWSFWHAPIWFLGTEFSGRDLLAYAMVFVICITSLGFIMGICYHRYRNLFLPIWMHFIFNLLGAFFRGPKLDLVSWYAAFYSTMAIGTFMLSKSNRLQLLNRSDTAANSGPF